MTTEQKDILNKIASLREEYKAADQDKRKDILKEVKALCQQLPQIPENCINCNMRKALPAQQEHGRLCGEECHKEWADRTYGVKGLGKRRSLEEVKRDLLNKAKEKYLPKNEQTKLYD